MFTGIIEEMGIIKRMTRKGEDALLEIDTSMNLDDVKIGDSISVSGACLTVTVKTDDSFAVDVSAETLSKTTLRMLKRGDRVNLEKSLKVNDFLGGHIVLGHVDCVGKICEKVVKSNSVIFGVEIDSAFSKYLVEKGSVTVDGISLTVNRCEKNRFYVNIVPHTARVTTLQFKAVANPVNIETDILGKYVEKLLHRDEGIDMSFLAEHGFK
ncbi:MAG: riboflavin synthase [Thermodesulfobacteriota bacterium]|nr:riboflavin synthase [Thermodesulfobacteriota bacterium]